MNSDPIVFVVDDDPSIRKTICALVESIGVKTEAYGSASEFLKAYHHRRPGCLVLDVYLPDLSGPDLVKLLKEKGITIPIVMISGDADASVAEEAEKTGAFHFLEKPFKPEVLLNYIGEALLMDIEKRRERASYREIHARFDLLTPREREVMDLIVAGKATKQIAEQLGVSGKTVRAHRARMMRKMQATSVVQLAELIEKAFHPGSDAEGGGNPKTSKNLALLR